MSQYVNLAELNGKILALLKKHDLDPKVVSLRIVLPTSHFENIATGHPDYTPPSMIQANHTDSELQWGIIITRKPKLEDFPPGTISTLPIE